jgi:hypothetical protein
MRSREEALKIARSAYKSITALMEEWEEKEYGPVDWCWDRCIGVDDYLFHEQELDEMD